MADRLERLNDEPGRAEERRLRSESYLESKFGPPNLTEVCGLCGRREAVDENGEFRAPCPWATGLRD